MTNLVSQSSEFLLLQVAQVTLVILLVGLVTRLFCCNRPYVALALWVVVLIKCVMPPLVYSPCGLFCWMDPIAQESQQSSGLQLATIDSADTQFAAVDGTRALESGSSDASLSVDSNNTSRPSAVARAVSARFGDTAWPTIAVSVWLGAQDEVDAAATPADGSAFWKNRWVLFQQNFAAAEPTLISQQGTSDGLKNSAQAEPANRPLASVTTGTSDPIVYQFLDDELFRAFLNHCQEDEQNPIILAPKVTLFDGQTAEISDCSQRPFVTDVTKVVGDVGVAYQPVTKVFWEGTKMQLAPVITPEGHRMICRFRFASIDDCKTFRSSRYPDAKNVRIQHPVITTASLECAIDIPTGKTLLIGGLFPRRVERHVKQGAISRLLGRQPTESVSEVTYIAITPRAVIAEK